MNPQDIFTRAGQALFGTGQDWKAQFGAALMVKPDSIDAMTKGKSRIPPGIWNEVADLLKYRSQETSNLQTKSLVAKSASSFKITLAKLDGTHIVVGATPGVLFEGTMEACDRWVANRTAEMLRRSASTAGTELTPSLCRAARAMIGISLESLADHSGVATADLQRFELDGVRLNTVSMIGLAAAFENAGIEFLPEDKEHGAGLRRRTPEFEVQPFKVYPEGVGFGARYRGQRYRFLVEESVLDDLIRGNARSESEQLAAANRFRALIYQAAARAAANHGGGEPFAIRLDHGHFPREAW
jgi:transcriptional regulator with XRE-family HTH domain